MNPANARGFLLFALDALEHIGTRTKQDAAALARARLMIESACDELKDETPKPLEVPVCAREGISEESRAAWRRK